MPYKVLFTNRPVDEEITKTIGSINHSAHIYLGSMLNKQKEFDMDEVADVMIDDVNEVGIEEFKRTIEESDPDIIGTSVYEANYKQVERLIEEIRSVKPEVVVAVGGQTPTQIPKSILKMTGADIAFRGEADFTFRQAVEKLSKGEPLENLLDINGIVIQKEGKLLHGNKSKKVPSLSQKDLRSIEFDFDLMAKMQERIKYSYISFSFHRGCPNTACSYCQADLTSTSYKGLAEEKIIEIISEINRLPGVELLRICDAVFGRNNKGAKSLMRKLIKNNFDFDYYRAEFSVDQLLLNGEFGKRPVDMEFLELMKEAVIIGELGIEHLSSGGLKKYNKFRYTPEEAMEVLRAFGETGALTGANFLHIGPDISASDLAEHFKNTIQICDELLDCENKNIIFNHTEFIVPYMGTREYQKIIQNADYMEKFITRTSREPYCAVKLPEDDGYEFIIERYFPSDLIVHLSFGDKFKLRYYNPDLPQSDMLDIFLMVEAMKKYSGPQYANEPMIIETLDKIGTLRPETEELRNLATNLIAKID